MKSRGGENWQLSIVRSGWGKDWMGPSNGRSSRVRRSTQVRVVVKAPKIVSATGHCYCCFSSAPQKIVNFTAVGGTRHLLCEGLISFAFQLIISGRALDTKYSSCVDFIFCQFHSTLAPGPVLLFWSIATVEDMVRVGEVPLNSVQLWLNIFCSSQPSLVHWLSSSIFPCSVVRLLSVPLW